MLACPRLSATSGASSLPMQIREEGQMSLLLSSLDADMPLSPLLCRSPTSSIRPQTVTAPLLNSPR